MEWTSLIAPAVVAAVVSGIVSIVGFVVSARNARRIHAEKLTFDREQAEKRFEFDTGLAERRFQLDKNFVSYHPYISDTSTGAIAYTNLYNNNQEPRRLWLSVTCRF